MADINYTNIEITYSNGLMSLCINNELPSTANFDDVTEDDSAPNNFRLEVNIARVFHKVLNLLKADASLFQKPDYELLGEMLGKILFGRLTNTSDARLTEMRATERMLSLGNNVCRIFLNFNNPSQIAVLPWEYTLYKSRGNTKPSRAWYLSANTDMPYHLMRRVASNPTPVPVAKSLYVMVLLNVLGNSDAVPRIDSRFTNLSELKKNFTSVNETLPTGSYPLRVKFLDNIKATDIRNEVETTYRDWQQEYNEDPVYVIHYVGHAMMQNEKGQLSIIDNNGKANWMEDRTFASYFDSNVIKIPPPSLVCLQACDSGKIGVFQNELRGVAYEFARLNIPAVVGMQNEINISDSGAFFNSFYRSLLSGKDVSEATTAGRNYLGREKNTPPVYQTNAFGSPVLFVTTEEPVKLLKPVIQIKENTGSTQDSASFSLRNDPSQKVTEIRARTESPVIIATEAEEFRKTALAQNVSAGIASQADNNNRGDSATASASSM